MTGQADTTWKTAPPSTWQMYRAMVGVGILCGLLIVTVFQLTKPIIERNKAEALQSAIFQVLPEARSSATFQLTSDDRFEPLANAAAGDGGDRLIHAGYDDRNRLVGLAVEAQGMGYQDVIRIIYGYSFGQEAVVGIRVLETKETPGLGDKIEKDPTFLENFKKLDVTLTGDRSQLANPIEFVKPGEKQHAWQIDGITGATISSTAIARILNGSTAFWIPRIQAHLGDFETSAAESGSPSGAD